jgi:hypothetical protein
MEDLVDVMTGMGFQAFEYILSCAVVVSVGAYLGYFVLESFRYLVGRSSRT